jgi:hypothetical protein
LPVEIPRPGSEKEKKNLFACARLRHQASKSRFLSLVGSASVKKKKREKAEDDDRPAPSSSQTQPQGRKHAFTFLPISFQPSIRCCCVRKLFPLFYTLHSSSSSFLRSVALNFFFFTHFFI